MRAGRYLLPGQTGGPDEHARQARCPAAGCLPACPSTPPTAGTLPCTRAQTFCSAPLQRSLHTRTPASSSSTAVFKFRPWSRSGWMLVSMLATLGHWEGKTCCPPAALAVTVMYHTLSVRALMTSSRHPHSMLAPPSTQLCPTHGTWPCITTITRPCQNCKVEAKPA